MKSLEYRLTLKPWAKYFILACFVLTLGKKVWTPKLLFNMEAV